MSWTQLFFLAFGAFLAVFIPWELYRSWLHRRCPACNAHKLKLEKLVEFYPKGLAAWLECGACKARFIDIRGQLKPEASVDLEREFEGWQSMSRRG